MKRINTAGFIATTSFHLVVVLFFMYYSITSLQAPPPPDLGVEVNFGDGLTGSGNLEPSVADKQEEAVMPPPVSGKDENILTQDNEDAPVIEKTQTTKPVKTNVTPNITKNIKQTESQPIVTPTVNKKALYPGKNTATNATGSEGVAGGKGNQGSPFGTVNSTNHANGNSRGNGGATFSLAGRNPLSLPKPNIRYNTEGKVVVTVTVDKQGRVTKAVAGARGSTTLDEHMLEAAEKAALQARFDVSSSAPAYQVGTITYHFGLQ
jgi:TonB family protein